MCSGIGPAAHLQEHGITVIADVPGVGENLQDHPAVVVSFNTPKKGISVTSKLRLFGVTNPFPVLKWYLFRTGLLTSTGCDHGAFVRTSAADGQPDLQIRFLAARAVTPDGMTSFSQFRNTRKLVSLEEIKPCHPMFRLISDVCFLLCILFFLLPPNPG